MMMERMRKAILHLGSNKESREQHLADALHSIEKRIGSLAKESSIYETEPWGEKEQMAFLNIAVEVHTKLMPHSMLQEINAIENELGRTRDKKWGSRTIDIDILFIENEVIKDERLTIPHPFIEKRNFVMVPLNEIVPDLIHPNLNKKISQLLKESDDTCMVKLWNSTTNKEKPA